MRELSILLFCVVAGVFSQDSQPPEGQRCSGRNYSGRRCCTPEQPCGLGEGDCDGPLDGGVNDGHNGCAGNLKCGSNNCQKFGLYFHPKDDCCDLPENVPDVSATPIILPGTPIEPPAGQRCRGRNYDGKRCCTPENPCDEGEGDCDGPEDGGKHDGHKGCKGDLVCGSNNCKKFGAYYHEKDDCCERPALQHTNEGPRQQEDGWGPWSEFGPCSVSCGVGFKQRIRHCVGNGCGGERHLQDIQERICEATNCNNVN